MVTSGLFFFPCPPNSTSSPIYQTLTSHLIRRHSECSPLPPFHLDHRFYTTTSSLLPGSKIEDRRFTQVVSVSRTPEKTYIGVSPLGDKPEAGAGGVETAIVSVPSGSVAEGFNDLVMRKFQPLWVFRQNVRIDNGLHVALVPGDWQIHIGEVRVSSGQGQGNLRGVAVGLHWMGDDEFGPGGPDVVEKQPEANQMIFASFFDALFRESGVSSIGMRSITKVAPQEVFKGYSHQDDWSTHLARQYMELLRSDKNADALSEEMADFRSQLKMWRT